MLILGALLVGLSLGLVGGGGSMLCIPLLIYVGGYPIQLAIKMTLLVVLLSSVVGLINYTRQGLVEFRKVLFPAMSGCLGAFYGARLVYLVSQEFLISLFSILLIFISFILFFSEKDFIKKLGHSAGLYKLTIACVFIGFLTGLLGLSGGFLLVPSLIVFFSFGMSQAVATSLLMVVANSSAAILSHGSSMFKLYEMAGPGMWVFVLMPIIGALIGSQFNARVNAKKLKKVLACFIFILALLMLFK